MPLDLSISDPATSAPRPAPVLEMAGVDVPSPGDTEQPIVRQVEWRVEEGDFWVVTAPPGSGKSSVLGVAAGLVRPTQGVHRLFGSDLAGLSEREQAELRLRVGVVFAGDGRLFSRMTVAQNIALPLEYHGRDDDKAVHWMDTLMEALDLTRFGAKYPREVPRWSRPRIALARAAVLRPSVLMLDDPGSTGALDDESWWIDKAQKGIGDWKAVTWILATSHPRPWAPLATRFAVVEGSKWRLVASLADAEAVLRPATTG
ncbi:MAG: ATP-binding cassette domain-containing protein [Verrucomicrobiales bacterium]|nr:ATP-binding cassette domain-containing protein [Verrucomicrobiales bacterium]